MSLYQIFVVLKETSSRKEKEAILKTHYRNELLKHVFRLALDPMTQFHIKKIPEYKSIRGSSLDLQDAIIALGELSSRKVTGNAAIEYLRRLLASVTPDDAKVLERIIQKDPDCGVQASTVNKIWKDLVPEYPCMLASGFDQKLVDKIKFPAIVQTKMDGMRFNAIVNASSGVEYRSRNGKEILVSNPLLDQTFLQMAKNIGMGNVVFDGELLVADSKGNPLDRKTGNGILNKAVKGTISDKEAKNIRAVIWDVIPLKYFNEGKCSVDYETRLATVVTAVDNLDEEYWELATVVQTLIADTADEAQEIFQKLYDSGEEGIILKSRDGIWENKRSKSQIKYKGELECDLRCVSWIEGTGKNKGILGALALESSDKQVQVSVGTGLTDDMRKNLKKKDVVGKIVTVKYNARIKSRDKVADSLFLPVFLEIREDKSTADSGAKIK